MHNDDFHHFDVVMYHGPRCSDGFTAAWVVYHYFEGGAQPKFVPVNYGDELNYADFENKSVLIVDVTFPLRALLALNNVAAKVVLLDHHKTAVEKLTGNIPFEHVFDTTKSGAMLAWEYFFDGEAPGLVKYVQDRDLWKWELSWSKEINAVIQSKKYTFEEWDELFDEIEKVPIIVGTQGRAILNMQDKLVSEIVAHKRLLFIKKQPVYVVNTSVLQSDVCDRLLEMHPGNLSAAYYQADNGQYRFSLRSRDTLPAANEIAEKFPGGGGHRNAAGFTASKLEDVFE